jgi:hypothetical protein
MNDRELYDFYDVYGHLPVMYNRNFDTMVSIEREKLNIQERFELANTLHRDEGERPREVKKGMKVMAIVFYALSFAGVFIQATDIIPGIPDRITFSVIVGGLVAANLMQWHQAIKDREQSRKSLQEMMKDHRGEIRQIQDSMFNLVKTNQDAIQQVLREMKK